MKKNGEKQIHLRKILGLCMVVCMLFSLGSITISAYSDVGSVGVPAVKQSKSYWCWAACSESILRHYGKSVTQATFVAYVKNDSSAPNKTASDSEVKSGLSHWGVTGTLVQNSVSFSTLSSNIRSDKPIYAGWSWKNNGGHALVISGYDGTSSSSGFVEYMDPGDGAFHVSTYNTFKGGSSYDHVWDGSIYNLKAS